MDIKDIKINNIDGKQYNYKIGWIGGSQDVIITMLPANKGSLRIMVNKEHKLIFNQVLSTFKFTEK